MAGRRIAASLGVLRIINLRALRRHAFRALLAAISLGGGVAVVVAVMIEATSVTKAVEDVGYRIRPRADAHTRSREPGRCDT